MEIECTFVCTHCLQINATVVDPTGGVHQEYIEDCQVCCQAMEISLELTDGGVLRNLTVQRTD
jgi:hypothetical protein